METTQQPEKNDGCSEFEEITIKYLNKKGVVRFSEFFEWLQTAMANPPVKSKVSTSLDKLAEEGKIFSWNKKGARYISPVKDINEIRNEVYEFIEKKWIDKEKIKFDEIEDNLNYPPNILHDILMSLVSDGKILNNVIDGVIYYRLPPIHSSIKFGVPLILIFISFYLFFNKSINKEFIFFTALLFLSAMLILWNKKR